VWEIEEVIKPTVEYIKERIPPTVKIKEEYESKFKLEVDVELFSWLLENLIKNSIDAQSTEVIIKVRKMKGKKLLVVKDNGEGIPKKIRKKLFSPGVTTKQFGWGIGLSFVKRIVTLHKWKITYEPNKKGKGVSFIITMGR
jgi:signal transduction histidine kinase